VANLTGLCNLKYLKISKRIQANFKKIVQIFQKIQKLPEKMILFAIFAQNWVIL
jgi:hypothetical protein